MKVLLVDDDRTVRFLLKVILQRSLDCTVSEAENGLDALERLSEERFDLLILDVNMPVVDGVETLRAVRASAEHATLPIVMISADRQDSLVRQCIALGINDYITKPFNADQITLRLGRFLSATRSATSGGSGTPTAPGRALSGSWHLGRGDTVIVAEGNADYRHVLASTLQTRCTVLQADTGPRALKLVLETRPAVLLVGHGLGVLGGAQLVALIRKAPAGSETRCIGLLPKTATDEERAGFDRVMTRSFVPDALLAEFDALFAKADAPSDSLRAGLEEHVVSASAQFCGMVLGTEVVQSQPVPPCRDDDRYAAHVEIIGTDSDLLVEFEVRCDSMSALLMYNQAVGEDPHEAGEDDKVSVLSEAANIIAGRLLNSLVTRGIRAQASVPATTIGPPRAAGPDTSEHYFVSHATGLAFRTRLRARLPEAAAA